MITFKSDEVRRVLCIGAHSDDIEIGCGGTMLKLAGANKGLEVLWVVFSAGELRAQEARRSARAFLGKVARRTVEVKDFRGSYFPFQGEEIKEYFETLKGFNPDVIFTHYRDDRHQDHRVLSDLAWNTFRDHLILEYEIPKYDGDLGVPNLFVKLDDRLARQKVDRITRCFTSQRDRHWFSKDTFLALMRLRGMECASKYAEAFYCRKMVAG